MHRPLTQKQLNFVKGILDGKSQYKAYTDSGYKIKTEGIARTCSSDLMRKPNIVSEIERRRSLVAKKTTWNQARLIEEWAIELKTCRLEEDRPSTARALENIGKMIGAYQQIEGDTLVLNQFLTKVQGIVGITDTEDKGVIDV